ncbi:hypothetical protein FHW89_001428 [Mucilaginibacter sp. SG564]|nr:hypothetical protein [Mucilaginibacter sp. SG564]
MFPESLFLDVMKDDLTKVAEMIVLLDSWANK